MKDYRSFITEAKKALKTVVMAFGRMNPPTVGHQKLVNKVRELADRHNAHHEVIVSHSQDAQKNPLSQEQKLKHAKRYFPDTNIVGSSKEHPNFLAHAQRLHQAGHEHLIMVAGQDRVKEFHDTLKRYNGTHSGALFNFKKISVVSAGARDPDAEGVEGMSASKMREHAKNNNFDEFRKGVPGHVSDEHAKELFHDTRKGMGLHEQVDEACWDGYKAVGMKKKGNRMVPNCVPEEANLDKPTMTPEEIAKKHKVDVKEINRQLEMGIKVEKEHTKDEKIAREIALDHLGEKPNYYSKLKQYVESVVKVGTLIENDLGEVGKVLSLRENSVVYNVLATGMMKSSRYGDFSLVEAIGHLATGAPDYFFGGVADAPKDKQEEIDRSPQDKDVGHKKHTTPAKYYAGLERGTKEKRYDHFRKNTEKSPKDPSAYEPAPGDANAKTKPSKHTEKYKRMYGESGESIPEGILSSIGGALLGKRRSSEPVSSPSSPTSSEPISSPISRSGSVKSGATAPSRIDPDVEAAYLRAAARRLRAGKDSQSQSQSTPTGTSSKILGPDGRPLAMRRFASAQSARPYKSPWATSSVKRGSVPSVDATPKKTTTPTTTPDYRRPRLMGLRNEFEMSEETLNNLQTENLSRDETMNEEAAKGLAAKAKKSGIPLSILRKVYNRGMAAWRGGHRPGTTPQQWAMARVNSYITKGKGTYYGADSDLSGQGKKKMKKENVSTDFVGTGMNVPFYGSLDKVGAHNESIDEAFETFMNENVHALDTNMESHLFGTDAARIAAQQMTPGEPGYVGMGKEASNFVHSREGEPKANQEKSKEKNKKSQEEDYPGGDYNSRLSGAPAAVGGLGGSYSINVQENALPNVDSIRAWALKESTQRNFIERYGNEASKKLIEAAHRMVNSKTSFTSFRQKLDEADYAPQAFSMGSGSGPVLSPPETGYAKQAFGEGKKKPKMEKVNEDEVTFHCEEDELIEALQWDEETTPIEEAEYQGRKVQLGKPTSGDVKKSKVYVKGPSGRVVKVNFGDKNMTIKKNIPARRKSFRARHHCENPGPRWKPRYWSCRAW